MGGNAASVAYLILAVFLGGFTLGVIATVAVAVRMEDRRYSLSEPARGPLTRGARWFTGYGGSGSHYRPRDWG